MNNLFSYFIQLLLLIVLMGSCLGDHYQPQTFLSTTQEKVLSSADAVLTTEILGIAEGEKYTKYGHLISRSPDPQIDANNVLVKIDSTSDLSTGFIIQDSITNELDGNSTYYVRAFIQSGAQALVYGQEVSFTTPEAPSVAVRLIGAESIGKSQVTLRASIKESLQNITEHGFVWHTSSSPTIDNELINKGSLNTTSFSELIKNLTPDTQYYVRAFVRIGDQAPTYSNEVAFKTNIL
ncbi:MAG TPA: hypothetical protein DCS93_07045 [Microscillaceae bacterium]|nr:hypothetical protein [Microscillaceae bacterium]